MFYRGNKIKTVAAYVGAIANIDSTEAATAIV
jgi:hypothetical protein